MHAVDLSKGFWRTTTVASDAAGPEADEPVFIQEATSRNAATRDHEMVPFHQLVLFTVEITADDTKM